MKKSQVFKQLGFLYKDLEKADKRSKKIAKALGIEQDLNLKTSLEELKELIEFSRVYKDD